MQLASTSAWGDADASCALTPSSRGWTIPGAEGKVKLCVICWLQPKLTYVQLEGSKHHQGSGHAKCLCLSQNRINQLHLETGRMLPLLRAGGYPCAPSGTQHRYLFSSDAIPEGDVPGVLSTWEPVTKEACRAGPKCPKCPKWKKSQISSHRSPRRDRIVTLQM